MSVCKEHNFHWRILHASGSFWVELTHLQIKTCEWRQIMVWIPPTWSSLWAKNGSKGGYWARNEQDMPGFALAISSPLNVLENNPPMYELYFTCGEKAKTYMLNKERRISENWSYQFRSSFLRWKICISFTIMRCVKHRPETCLSHQELENHLANDILYLHQGKVKSSISNRDGIGGVGGIVPSRSGWSIVLWIWGRRIADPQ